MVDFSTQNVTQLLYFTCSVYSSLCCCDIRICYHACASEAQGHRVLCLQNILGDDKIRTYKNYKHQMNTRVLALHNGIFCFFPRVQGHRVLCLQNILGDDKIRTYKNYKHQMNTRVLALHNGIFCFFPRVSLPRSLPHSFIVRSLRQHSTSYFPCPSE